MQFVFKSGFRSKIGLVTTDDPRDSILGPLLFSIYIFQLGLLLISLGHFCQFYADNTYMHWSYESYNIYMFYMHCYSHNVDVSLSHIVFMG